MQVSPDEAMKMRRLKKKKKYIFLKKKVIVPSIYSVNGTRLKPETIKNGVLISSEEYCYDVGISTFFLTTVFSP